MKREPDSLLRELVPWLRLLARRRRRMLLGALLMGLTVAAAIGLLGLSGWFITATALTGALLAAGVAAGIDVYVPGAGIRLFAVVRTVSRYLERLYNHDTVLRLLADLRGGMFLALARLDAKTLSRQRASEWLNRLTADIDTLDNLYLRQLAPPAVALLAVLVVALLLGLFVPPAAILTGAMLLLLLAWITVGQATLGMAASQRRVVSVDRLRSRVIEHVQGLAELRAFGASEAHRERIHQEADELYRDQRYLGRLTAFGNAFVGVGVSLTMLVALWLGAQAYHAGLITGPVMVMMPLAVLALGETFAGLSVGFSHFGATRAAARRLNAMGRSRSTLATPQTPVSLPRGHAELRLDEVTLCYPGSLSPALQQVTLRLGPGERGVLLGASGAGKSSVAQLATRLVDPDEGCVMFGGIELRQASLGELHSRVAYLTQQTELFDDSLAANLRLASPQANNSQLWHVLKLVELDGWAASLPQRLETRVGESGRQLSGGQARRVALARILLREASLVILDEPFAGLDRPLACRIAQRLDACLAGRSVLYLLHQLGEDEVAPPGIERSWRLVGGRLDS